MKGLQENSIAGRRRAHLSPLLGAILACLSVHAVAQNSFPNGINAGSGPNFWVSPNGTAGVMTAVGGPIFQVRQYGSGYGSTSATAALALSTDNPNGAANYLMTGSIPGVTTYFLRADGTAYYAGYVGIGTSSPGARLEVAGNIKLTAGSGASVTYQDGSVQSTAWNGVLGGGDYAESVDVGGDRTKYEPGDVLVIDPEVRGQFVRSSKAYSTTVAGIYSTKPGVRGRRQLTALSEMKEEVPMAMIGIVPTKVCAEGGPIALGDLLVTSSTPGYAMKGSDRTRLSGAVVGKAMSDLKLGTGVIEVLVSLQ